LTLRYTCGDVWSKKAEGWIYPKTLEEPEDINQELCTHFGQACLPLTRSLLPVGPGILFTFSMTFSIMGSGSIFLEQEHLGQAYPEVFVAEQIPLKK